MLTELVVVIPVRNQRDHPNRVIQRSTSQNQVMKPPFSEDLIKSLVFNKKVIKAIRSLELQVVGKHS